VHLHLHDAVLSREPRRCPLLVRVRVRVRVTVTVRVTVRVRVAVLSMAELRPIAAASMRAACRTWDTEDRSMLAICSSSSCSLLARVRVRG